MSQPARKPEQRAPVTPKRSGSMQAVVKAEKLSQIALALPAAVFVGWLLGFGLDKLLHQHWIYIAGLVLGAVAGFVQIVRMISSPEMTAASAYDPSAPGGPGYKSEKDTEK